FQWLGQWVPKWDLLLPTEGGIKFKPHGEIVILEPGEIFWWWPVTTYIFKIATNRQTLTFGQRLTTKDGFAVQLDTVIAFTIYDAKLAIIGVDDFEDTVGEIAQKITLRPIMGREFSETRADMGDSNELRNEITRGAKKLLHRYGLDVEDGYVCNFTKTTVFSHDGGVGFVGEGEEEEEE
ncbi:hypothetical protein LCGC14_0582080, partial [marine sediment metagenome]